MGAGVRLLAGAFAGLVILFLLAPVVVLVPMSLGSADIAEFPPRSFSLAQYRNFFDSRPWLESAATSLRVALITAAAATTLGTMAAFALVRGAFPGRAALSALLIAPRFVPVIITALAFYALLAGLGLTGTETGLVLAHVVLASPYVIIIVSATLRGFDTSLEQASQSLGASPLRTALHVTLPLIRPGIVSAASSPSRSPSTRSSSPSSFLAPAPPRCRSGCGIPWCSRWSRHCPPSRP